MSRSGLRSLLSSVFDASGASALLRYRLRRHLLVLCYHGVVEAVAADRFGYGNTVSIAEFRQHLQFLAKHFRPVSIADVIADREGRRALPERAALVTFDDGYRNNLVCAAPVLLETGVPCAFFVTTSYAGSRNVLWTDDLIGRILAFPGTEIELPGQEGLQPIPSGVDARRAFAVQIKERCKRLDWAMVQPWLEALRSLSPAAPSNAELYDFMSWDEVRALNKAGFDIGSHTVNHPILTRIPADTLARELTESKASIERELQVPCESIAYPNGGAADVSAAVFAAARAAGYRVGFTVAERHSPPGEDPLSISRLCIQGHLPMDAFTYRVNGLQRLLH